MVARRLLAPALFFAALLPRLAALGRYVTPDELIWVYRSVRFRQALLAGDWASTLQSGHPGVVTTWLGTAAIQLQLWLQPADRAHLDWIETLYWLSPDNGAAFKELAVFLTAVRLSVILVAVLGVVAVYRLAGPRLGGTAALLGALFLALDPFVAGLSGIFHVDALLATFALLALLLVLPEARDRERTSPSHHSQFTIALSGVCAALAVLSKTPGLLLLPFVPAVLLWRYGRASVRPLLVWAAATAATAVLLMPALWAAPDRVYDLVFGLAGRMIDTALRPTFFLGQSVFEPGPAFYPVAIAYRLSPIVFLGLVAGLVWALLVIVRRPTSRDRLANPAWLFLFAAAFVLLLNLAEKKFDRYALPAMMPLILLGGWGAAQAVRPWPRRAAIALVALHAAFLLAAWPYPLLAYNPLLGGSTVAARLLPQGWGEDAGVAARTLAADLPDPSERVLFTGSPPSTAPFWPGPVRPLTVATAAHLTPDDVILIVEQDWQIQPQILDPAEPPLPVDRFPAGREPDETIRLNGRRRALAFTGLSADDFLTRGATAVPRPHAQFGQAVTLVAAGALDAAWPQRVPLEIGWLAAQPADFQLVLELTDAAGGVWARQEGPLLNAVDQPGRFWPPGQSQTVAYELPFPADTPPGRYTIVASLFDANGARQGVTDDDGRFRGVSAPVTEVAIGPAVEPQPQPDIPIRLETGGELVGRGPLAPSTGSGQALAVEPGGTLTLDLWWQRRDAPSGTLSVAIGPWRGETAVVTDAWQPGQIYHIRPAWRLPPDLPPGEHSVTLDWLDENGRSRWPEPVALGTTSVSDRQRTFALPPLTPLGVGLGDIAFLQGLTVTQTAAEVVVQPVWQAAQPDGRAYTAFVHLRDAAGQIVDQVDRPPDPSTAVWLPDEVIVDAPISLVPPGPGMYSLAVGLYDAETFDRLPVAGPDGALLPDDQFIVPLVIDP